MVSLTSKIDDLILSAMEVLLKSLHASCCNERELIILIDWTVIVYSVDESSKFGIEFRRCRFEGLELLPSWWISYSDKLIHYYRLGTTYFRIDDLIADAENVVLKSSHASFSNKESIWCCYCAISVWVVINSIESRDLITWDLLQQINLETLNSASLANNLACCIFYNLPVVVNFPFRSRDVLVISEILLLSEPSLQTRQSSYCTNNSIVHKRDLTRVFI